MSHLLALPKLRTAGREFLMICVGTYLEAITASDIYTLLMDVYITVFLMHEIVSHPNCVIGEF